MLDKVTIVIFLTWYFLQYGPPIILYYNLLSLIKFDLDYEKIINTINVVLFNGYINEYWLNDSDSDSDSDIDISSENNKIINKYEDKYLQEIRKLNKEWEFNDEEKVKIEKLSDEIFSGSIENIKLKLNEISNQINELQNEINDNEEYVDNYSSDENSSDDEDNKSEHRKEILEKLKIEYDKLLNDLNSSENIANIKNDSINNAKKIIINERLDKIKSCYVFEKTPLGNVLMVYDREKGSFKYYSDCSMPYRYLEPVGRKFVKFFNCRPIFIDMDEELKLFEEKCEKEQELNKQKQIEKKNENKKNDNLINNKNVFAKFKNYNKDAGGKISMAPPPKNSIPNRSVIELKENEKILLKERANRYTYEGKLANFSFLQKIERKIFNKRLGLTFSEFKKLNPK